ncbi:hypothetical protein EDD22DRAFT_951067 [Suillus occidentalis]|nr:hypothetical protein EDD22DRAFT_951067 [Suillus occidentalis]
MFLELVKKDLSISNKEELERNITIIVTICADEAPEASNSDTRSVAPTPTPVPANSNNTQGSLQAHINELITKLSETQIANLISDKPLSSSIQMPPAAVTNIQSLTHTTADTSKTEPKTKNKTLLLVALQEAEELCESYQNHVITLQAQAILNEAYCNKLHNQLAFREKKATNSDAPGKLVNDGLPRLLSGDEFYKRVVEFTRWQKQKEADKVARKDACTQGKGMMDEWKAKEAEQKAENVARQECFHAAKAVWEDNKQQAKIDKRKFTTPAPKLGELLKPLPKPKVVVGDEEESGEEFDLEVVDESSDDSEKD